MPADRIPAPVPPAAPAPYDCCGKVGRISRHESWCPTNKPPRRRLTAADSVWQGRSVAVEREDGDLYVVVGRPMGDRMRARITDDEALILAAVLARAAAEGNTDA